MTSPVPSIHAHLSHGRSNGCSPLRVLEDLHGCVKPAPFQYPPARLHTCTHRCRRFTNAAAIYVNDAFGEGYKESLVAACLQMESIQAFPYIAGDVATIERQVQRLADSSSAWSSSSLLAMTRWLTSLTLPSLRAPLSARGSKLVVLQ